MSNIWDKLRNEAGRATFEADKLRQTTNIQSNIKTLKTEISQAVTQLGSATYERYRQRQLNDPYLRQFCEHIAALQAQITARERELEQIRSAQYTPPAVHGHLCPNGHGELPAGHRFCHTCGAPAIAVAPAGATPCQQCRTPLPPNTKFCTHCGAKQQAGQKRPSPQAASPQPPAPNRQPPAPNRSRPAAPTRILPPELPSKTKNERQKPKAREQRPQPPPTIIGLTPNFQPPTTNPQPPAPSPQQPAVSPQPQAPSPKPPAPSPQPQAPECPACHAPTKPGNQFCIACGHNLTNRSSLLSPTMILSEQDSGQKDDRQKKDKPAPSPQPLVASPQPPATSNQCPACQADLLPNAHFCITCGHHLT